METPFLQIVEKSPRYYNVYLKDGSKVTVEANCYTCTDYSSFAFYREDIDFVNKAYLKSCPPAPIYEIPRRDVHCIAEEGHITIEKKTRKVRSKKEKKSSKKKIKSVLVKKKAQGK